MQTQPRGSHHIAGTFADDPEGDRFDSIFPATGEVIARLHMATPAIVESAVAAATEGQKAWAAMPARERGAVLARTAALLRERNRELSELETLDTGKPIQETLVADAASGAECLDFFAGLTDKMNGEYIDFGGPFGYTRREPLGICLGIGAWNYPIQIACWKSAPALACGNAMIFKPSETTPLSALALADIYREAGLPDGAFNVVQGDGRTGAALLARPEIAKVSLTGSVATGKRVMSAAAGSLKQVTLELGGKSPLIVFDDADLDNAVGGAMLGNFYSTGQICSNGTRVFVQRGALDAFLEKLATRTARMTIGDPRDEATQIGPLVSARQKAQVLDYIGKGKAEGARLVAGGSEVGVPGLEAGQFVAPTIFADVTDAMTIAREEIFGPVMCVLAFDDEAEVLERANATSFGLAAGVFTRDLARGHRMAARLEAGTCWINAYNLTPAGLPFGGIKHSGFGRENAAAAIESYSRLKSVYVETGDVDSPY
ncbi:MAG: betaine-aldehyde dehydrogenase [Rhodospirillales bacterium]